jgi:hypothetical protein
MLGLCRAQEQTRMILLDNDNIYSIPSYNYDGTTFISIPDFLKAFGVEYAYKRQEKSLKIFFEKYEINISARNPFLIVNSVGAETTDIIQLATSTHFVNGKIFISINEMLQLTNRYYETPVVLTGPGRLMVMRSELTEFNKIENVTLAVNEKGTFLKIKTEAPVRSVYSEENVESFQLGLSNTIIWERQFEDLKPAGLLKHISCSATRKNFEMRMLKNKPGVAAEIIQLAGSNELVIHFFERDDSYWLEKESEHFKVIYRPSHSSFINDILLNAERALTPLMVLFDYTPSSKILINTYDVSDYGFGTTITVPENFIRIEIEPLEPGYEVVPYNERIQWLLSHELVHIVVNDSKSSVEGVFRKLFGKVPPDKVQPATIFYSLLTNFNRYTPRWHQESVAVYFETWFSGGYGRLLGSFDEMLFRSMVVEGREFPSSLDIETIESHNSIFLENLFYNYGGRFVAYLSILYGADNVIKWFKTRPSDFLTGFQSKFKEIFGKDLSESWKDFIEFETQFQNQNIALLKKQKLTEKNKVGNQNFGWISSPQIDRKNSSVIFGYHKAHELSELQTMNLLTGKSKILTSLPTPSMLQVSSVAYDGFNGLLFYTTNNNQLFRDIWVYDIETNDKKILFENARVGDLTVNPENHELWGVEHDAGIVTLVISPYPYHELIRLVSLPKGDELFDLSIDRAGENIAAILKKPSGQQSLIILNCKDIVEESFFKYVTISSTGTPENPSWSADLRYLYWNAYTNGVSNIYRYDFKTSVTKAITHCVTGLFKPLEITPDSILAFAFTTKGFEPVKFKNEPAPFLPAITYLGQMVIEKEPKLYQWALQNDSSKLNPLEFSMESGYNSLSNLNLQSFVPVVSGFQKQVVFGLFTRISDPLLVHDFYLEAGISPLKELPDYPLWHFKFKYDYNQLLYFEVAHNGPEFFDLFNERKRGTIGTQLKLSHTHYWKYDNPHKIKQVSSLTYYTGVEYINDNLIRVSQPDFGVLATNFNSKDLRKSIGSSDYEFGSEINWTFTLYGTNFETPEFAPNTYVEYSDFSTWIWNHNILHVKIAGGYLWDNEDIIQARFFFGGFGNRAVDNDEIRQFRRVFRYPGIPIYSLMTDKFFKLMIENDFPPVRLSGWAFENQLINHLDFSLYSQCMFAPSELGDYWIDIGGQLDVKLKHWYNLESTFSAGIAKAWSDKISDWEWFLSLKILKD